jgi:hypothetical protein
VGAARIVRKSLNEERKTKALDDGLRDMFRVLEQRPVPDSLIGAVEQLEEGDARPARKAKRG